ncbi:MAG: general secretion pathway protein GspK [Deltaproteobacteria bacterium]|nr:general secretion pathway protein GspK [Deltaproteobacteria bacterium]
MKTLRNMQISYGFPVAVERGAVGKKRRGIALLIAMMTIMLMLGVVSDMIVTSSVNIELAVASRDRVKAEYLAKSGFNFAVFLLSMSWGFDLFRAQGTTPEFLKKPLADDASSLWNMINRLPPIGSTLVAFVKTSKPKADDEEDDDPFKLRSVFSERVSEQMELFTDSFSMKVSDEASKINVNECFKGRCTETLSRLIAFFSCPTEKEFLQSKNIDPLELAYRVKDFITEAKGASPESGFGEKNAPYENKTPPYKAKEFPFDTVNELRLVEGWDDDIHTVFAPYLTVYPYPAADIQYDPRINLNTISPELLSCLVPEARSQACAESFAIKMARLKEEKKAVVENDVKQTLSSLACYTGTSEDPTVSKNPEKWFDVKSSVFRIEIDASTGDQERKIVAVVRRIMPQDKSYNRDKQQVKRSYQILQWKLI